MLLNDGLTCIRFTLSLKTTTIKIIQKYSLGTHVRIKDFKIKKIKKKKVYAASLRFWVTGSPGQWFLRERQKTLLLYRVSLHNILSPLLSFQQSSQHLHQEQFPPQETTFLAHLTPYLSFIMSL